MRKFIDGKWINKYDPEEYRRNFLKHGRPKTANKNQKLYRERHKEEIAARRKAVRNKSNPKFLESERKYRETNRPKIKKNALNHRVKVKGMTVEDLNKLRVAQNNRCAICDKSPDHIDLHVDHDHDTGKIRGLLCRTCNPALGLFRDDPTLLLRAAEYLIFHKFLERDMVKL